VPKDITKEFPLSRQIAESTTDSHRRRRSIASPTYFDRKMQNRHPNAEISGRFGDLNSEKVIDTSEVLRSWRLFQCDMLGDQSIELVVNPSRFAVYNIPD
jgi:hypothetical protein